MQNTACEQNASFICACLENLINTSKTLALLTIDGP